MERWDWRSEAEEQTLKGLLLGGGAEREPGTSEEQQNLVENLQLLL